MTDSDLLLKSFGEKILNYVEGKSDFNVLENFILELENQGVLKDEVAQDIAHALYHYDQDTFTHINNLDYLSEMKKLMSNISNLMIANDRDNIPDVLDKFYNLPIR